jgi:plastocyanin
MKSVIASAVLFAACLVRAENFMVTVGVGGLIYNPNTVTANPGDTVEFVVTGVSPLIPPISV